MNFTTVSAEGMESSTKNDDNATALKVGLDVYYFFQIYKGDIRRQDAKNASNVRVAKLRARGNNINLIAHARAKFASRSNASG